MNILPAVIGGMVLAAFSTFLPTANLDALGWLGGCWESRSGDRVTLEMWSPPSGGLMVGASRTVVGGRARAYEHLRIRTDGDGFVYTAIPSGQVETAFRSASVSEEGFTVENPDHDFPTRITYRRTGEDAFTAIVEGPREGGEMSGFRVDYRRLSCEAGTVG